MLYGSETDLGLDPTMSIFSAQDNQIPRYNITVRVVDKSRRRPTTSELIYRTIRLINDDGARAFRGSGTRVWEVVPVVDNVEQRANIHVLKDHWLDDDREGEGDILKEILEEPSLEDEAREELTALFLTPVACGDVYITDELDKKERLDGTRTLANRGAEIPKDAAKFSVDVPQSYRSSHDSRYVGKSRRKKSLKGKRGRQSGDVEHDQDGEGRLWEHGCSMPRYIEY